MPKMIYICILLIYFKVISKKGGHYCPRLPYQLRSRINYHYYGINRSRTRSGIGSSSRSVDDGRRRSSMGVLD